MRNHRKKDSELFPTEIFNTKTPGLDGIPHSVIFVLDGSIDGLLGNDDSQFYNELLQISLTKGEAYSYLGYPSIHVVLTRFDVLEKQVYEKNKKLSLSEKNSIISGLKDEKIEKLIQSLGIKRSNIHFIENYHTEDEENVIEVDYHALKTMSDILNLSEQFLMTSLNRNFNCGCM